MNYLYASFQTNEISFLTSCIQTGSYGESELAIRAPNFDNLKELRAIKPGDRVFIHLRGQIFCGPFFVCGPHSGLIIDKKIGHWHKVNFEMTPPDLRPIWLATKPWCFFFDIDMSLQVNYCEANTLLKAGFRLPRLGTINTETGESLWQFIDEHGYPFSDFLQRQGAFAFRGFNRTPSAQFHQAALSKRYISSNEKSIPYRTKNGILVRSKSERDIANFLHDRGYRFEYERPTLFGNKLIRPDFYLPDCDLFIEHLGLHDSNPSYRENWRWRKALYDSNNRKVLTTIESDITDLESSLLKKLVSFGCLPCIH